jgi:hypothetical protein
MRCTYRAGILTAPNLSNSPTPPATHFAPGPCQNVRALKNRGRRESRAPDAPAALCARSEEHTSKSPQVHRKRSGLPCANGFNGFLRALLGESGFLATIASRDHLLDRLDASVEASGPHDFAVRACAARLAAPPRPPHPALNVRDDRDTPLMRGGTAAITNPVSSKRRSEIFFARGLDRWNQIEWQRKIGFWDQDTDAN